MSGRNYTRGRRVEYLARDRLRACGFCVIRSAGSRTPVDLVAGRNRQVLFVQTKRTRRPLADTRAVISRFSREITRLQSVLRKVDLPVQLWVFTDREGWRFYNVYSGGIVEVSNDEY